MIPSPLDRAIPELVALATERGVDLRSVRPSRVPRVLSRRMLATGSETPAQYAAVLRSDPEEPGRLRRALSVSVTSFFRDPTVFAAIGSVVGPALLLSLPFRHTLRCWSAAAATGEEAWSLAMVLADLRARFEVVGSDIDGDALAVGRLGRYPAAAIAAVPPPYVTRHLLVRDGWASIEAVTRGRVRFVSHDLAGSDLAPAACVLASFHLVLVRNVLIYLDIAIRDRLLERLATTLVPGGALVLGAAEGLPAYLRLPLHPFPGIDPALRIFRRDLE